MPLTGATVSSSSSSSSLSIRLWRAAFLTLRDETQTLAALSRPHTANILHHLNLLIFSQCDDILVAAYDLPPHEVESDIMLLMQLALNISDCCDLDDLTQSFIHLSKFIHGTIPCVVFFMDPATLVLPLDVFGRVLEIFLGKTKSHGDFTGNAAVVGAINQCLESVRLLFEVYQKKSLLSGYKKILDFLHDFVAYFQGVSTCSSENIKVSKIQCAQEVQKTAFAIIGEVYSKVGHSLQVDIWQSTIEILRRVMDFLASKGPLREDSVMAKFYCSVLHCLHLVLMDPKGSLSAHVAGFVAVLRRFLKYGVSGRNCCILPEASLGEGLNSASKILNLGESSKSDSIPYRPPHLRKELKNPQVKDEGSLTSAGLGFSKPYQALSDSDYSDSEGSVRDLNIFLFGKTRLAAIVCIQDLCRADPKVFTTQWTMLLPHSDILQSRKYEATLMSCLLFDPYVKARLASATAITAMLDGPTSVFLKVAEFKDSTKLGSFTALSISLGQMLMQLHSGTLHLLKHETHRGVLAALLKVLTALILSTPYSRMPVELLPTVISSVQVKIEDVVSVQNDQTSILAAAIDCLTVALSASPPSVQVRDMLLEEVTTGFFEMQKKSGILAVLFRCSEPSTCPSICFESLQAIRTVAHNYPSTMFLCWKQVSSVVHGFLCFTGDVPARLWKNNTRYAGGHSWEKVFVAAIKVLDECLRAISGFKGTENLSDDKLLDCPFTSDYIRTKTVSSAPLDGLQSSAVPRNEVNVCPLGSEQWSEAICQHIPLCLQHPSAVVDAALCDEVPSVRSAACRAIGVIACFFQVMCSGEILKKLIYAAVHNSNDSLVSVRITASWALANICDSLRYHVDVYTFNGCFVDSKVSKELILVLIVTALRLSKDNDKIKANAVRALGNLSRFVPFPGLSSDCDEPVDPILFPLISSNIKMLSKVQNLGGNSKSFQPATSKASDWLGKMVQAFVSCITTGNVKVQWNVCHALSNLFLNKTVELHDKDWASAVFSILLLLLRDSVNFKIRIQAAAALAVPSTVNDYGRSFYDVLQGMVHVLENLSSDQISIPANLKYKAALEMQLTSSMLHVIGLASETVCWPMEEFLVKKALFLEEWLRTRCLPPSEGSAQPEGEHSTFANEKRDIISRAIRSLIKIFEVGNHDTTARRFQKLLFSVV